MPASHLFEIDVHSPDGTALIGSVAAKHGHDIARAARVVDRLFLLRSSWAPGLRFVGGQIDGARLLPAHPPFSLAGTGEHLEDAFAACVGEGVERLSQIERDGDVVLTASLSGIGDPLPPGLAQLLAQSSAAQNLSGHEPLAWLRARCLANDGPVLLPADWCLRRRQQGAVLAPRTALSTGVAAGPTFESAAARALLELVERDAASLWWIGGRRGRPLALESAAAREGARLLGALRQDANQRASWLLDITTDLDIPAVAAISFDTQGRGFACGLAARLDLAAAVRAAILEMCQMELALLLARGRPCAADAVPGDNADRAPIERADKIDAEHCALVHPVGCPRDSQPDIGAGPLATLRAAFDRCNIGAALYDLSRREFGIPVVGALAPLLQPMPSCMSTARLRAEIARSGGTRQWTHDVSLV